MTVRLGKYSINLGWEVAIAIVISVAAFFFKTGSVTSDFLHSQQDIKKDIADLKSDLTVIKAQLNIKAKKDSNQDLRLDTLGNNQMAIRTRVRSADKAIRALISDLRTHNVSEKRVNGKLIFYPADGQK